ncbi:MAG: WD40 repeat domain-containing protein [Polyangiaceae bacterium]|nr:WD40 repeat domain-containing protein [Polyangiaceae bacterium]
MVLLSSEKLICLDRITGRTSSTASDVLTAAPTAEGRLLVVNNSRVSWHDVEHPLCTLPDSEVVMEAALHATTLRLATADNLQSISCFDIRTGKRVWQTNRLWAAMRELSAPRMMAFDNTGAHLALLALDETLSIRETSHGKVVGKCADVEAFAWHPSGKAVVVHQVKPYPGYLRLLNLSLDKPYWRTPIDMSWGGSSLLAFTPDGALLAVAEADAAKMFRTTDGEVLAAELLPRSTTAITLTAWNRRLALATMDSNGDVVQRDLAPR